MISYVLILSEFDGKSYNSYFPDNGIALLSSYIKNAGNAIEYFDLNIKSNWERLLTCLRESNPDIVGFKLFYNNLRSSIEVATRIKEEFPSVLTIAGGPHVTMYRESILHLTDKFDILIAGEGDQSINEIGEFVVGKRPKSEISNAIYKSGDNTCFNKTNVLVNLDNVPIPDWSSLQLREYFPIMQVNMSRGCPYQCSFCVHNAILSRGELPKDLLKMSRTQILKKNNIRMNSFDNVKRQIEAAHISHGLNLIVIPDSTPSKKLLSEFCNYLKSTNYNIRWSAFSRIGKFDEKFYRMMAQSGCTALFFGIESGNRAILNIMGKDYSPAVIKESVGWAQKNGIDIIGSFVLGHPGENSQSIEDTKRLIKDLNIPTVFLSPFALEPGSPIAFNSEEYGISLDEDWLDKTTLLPLDSELHEVDYYFIDGVRNHLHWQSIEKMYDVLNLGIPLDVFDNEYIKLLSSHLGVKSAHLYKMINTYIERDDTNSVKALIDRCWEANNA